MPRMSLSGDQVPIEWQRFFLKLAGRSVAKPAAVTVGASPFSWKAADNGQAFIAGGTVTDVTIARDGWTLTAGANANPINVELGDVVTITYSSAPDVTFLGG
jgi:hypothetical protein